MKKMKKIINGKVYDTETAKVVGGWDNGLGRRDFGNVVEILYRKRTGEYFIHGEGGPASKYSVSCGNNSWSGGEKIIPLSYQTAKEWAEEHLSCDEYELEFGPVAEDESTVAMSISLPAATAEKLRRVAAEKGLSVSAMIAQMVGQCIL